MIDFRDLIKTGIHFGHQTSRWHPLMNPYIWGQRGGVHLINVSNTAQQLENAAKFIENIVTNGRQVLLVGTKKAAQEVVEKCGKEANMPFVSHRWIGGTLTNYSQVKKSVTKLMHYEDIVKRSHEFNYTKKEFLNFKKIIDRLQDNVGGIRYLQWPLGAVVIIDIKKEETALLEARAAGVPVIALVDTNCDPSLVDYVIPGNDDSPKAIAFVVEYLTQAIKRGVQQAKANRQRQPVAEKAAAQEATQGQAAPKPAQQIELTEVEKAMLEDEESK